MTCKRCNPTDGRDVSEYRVPYQSEPDTLCDPCAALVADVWDITKVKGPEPEPEETTVTEAPEAEPPKTKRRASKK